MSILAQSSAGWLLDDQAFINNHYQHLPEPRECLPDLYRIDGEFVMDSEFSKVHRTAENTGGEDSEREPKRKKRKLTPIAGNSAELKQMEFHKELADHIEPLMTELLDLGKLFLVTDISRDNNKSAREAANIQGLSVDTSRLCADDGQLPETVIVEENARLPDDLTNRLVEYGGSGPTVVSWRGNDLLLPARCRFVLADFNMLGKVLAGEQFDCIVIDPPWENKSVKRKKSYGTLTDWDLYRLPVATLAPPSALVACWVTNRARQISFLKRELFRSWGVEYVAEWYWVKMTRGGRLVRDLRSLQKKPYETLVLGRRVEATSQGMTSQRELASQLLTSQGDLTSPELTSSQATSQEEKTSNADVGEDCGEVETEGVPELPTRRVLLSVPCSLHSRKPALHDVLSPYLPRKARCLELFARSLTPGWTSWGNEVLRNQHVNFFRRCQPSSSGVT